MPTSGTLPGPLAALMTQTVYLAYPTGTPDTYGKRTYGTPVAARAHVYERASASWNGSTQQRVTRTYVCTQSEIAADTRIWLPGLDSSDSGLARYAKGTVEQPRDERGNLWAYVAEV